MTQTQLSLDLKDRVLWFDGDSSMYSDRIADYILAGNSIDGIFPLEINQDVKKFNLYADKNLEIKETIRELDTTYTIPEEYKNLNLRKFFLKQLLLSVNRDGIDDKDEIEKRISRVLTELELFKQYNMENLVRTVIYIVDKFDENSVVWGTGRGSSCACYCLYLIGLHEVDSVKYDLELNEFFR